MCKIKHLSTISLFCVFVFGLFGCAPDSAPPAAEGNSSAWSAGQIQFLRGDTPPLDLKLANNAVDDFRLSDQLHFSSVENSSSPLLMTVKTSCLFGFNELANHTYTEALKSYYFYYEFLPSEAIFNSLASLQAPIKCSVRITLTNSSGDTHAFQLASLPLKIDQVPNFLILEKSKEPQIRRGNNLIEVLTTEMPLYTLPRLNSENQNYHLECSDIEGKINYLPGSVRFDQFEMNNRITDKKGNKLNPIQLCRIFAVENKNRVVKISDLFVFKKLAEGPILNPIVNLAAIHPINSGGNLIVGQYLISNPTAENMILGVNNSEKIIFTVVQSLGRNQYQGTQIEKLILPVVQGASPLVIGNQIRFSLAPAQSVTLTIYAQARSFHCSGTIAIGTYYRLANPQGLHLDILNDINAEATSQNTLLHSTLETPFERFAYYEPRKSGGGLGKHPVTPTITAPKVDKLGGRCEIY